MSKWPYTAADTRTIYVQTGNYCNLSCPGCARVWRGQAGEQMNTAWLDPELLVRRIVPGDWPSLERVLLSGNVDDPCMHPRLFEIIGHWLSVNTKLKIHMHTNGSLRTTKWFGELGRISADHPDRLRVIFAIDGLEDTNHIYRRGSNWQKIQDNWRAYIAAGGYALWQCVVFDHNRHQIEQIKQLQAAEGFRDIRLRYSGRQWADGAAKVTELPTHAGHSKVICKSTTSAERPPELFINHQGDVSPCCFIDLSNIKVSDRYLGIISQLGSNVPYNLHDADIDSIVRGAWFDWLFDNWQTNRECVKHCRDNLRDSVIIQQAPII